MLTNEEKLKDLRNLLVLNPDDPVDDYLTPADMIDFIDELLAFREAVAPQMAEVDALQSHYNLNYTRGVKLLCVADLANIARQSILSHVPQPQEEQKRCTTVVTSATGKV